MASSTCDCCNAPGTPESPLQTSTFNDCADGSGTDHEQTLCADCASGKGLFGGVVGFGPATPQQIAERLAAKSSEVPLCFHAAKGLRCTRYLEGAEAERKELAAWLRHLESLPGTDNMGGLPERVESKEHLRPRDYHHVCVNGLAYTNENGARRCDACDLTRVVARDEDEIRDLAAEMSKEPHRYAEMLLAFVNSSAGVLDWFHTYPTTLRSRAMRQLSNVYFVFCKRKRGREG